MKRLKRKLYIHKSYFLYGLRLEIIHENSPQLILLSSYREKQASAITNNFIERLNFRNVCKRFGIKDLMGLEFKLTQMFLLHDVTYNLILIVETLYQVLMDVLVPSTMQDVPEG